jgi:uncharacterized protein YjbI with pentapeptide repeats
MLEHERESISAEGRGRPDCGDIVSHPAPARCRFELVLLGDSPRLWTCPHSVERDGLCIHHLPKYSHEGRNTLPAVDISAAEDLDTRCRLALHALFASVETTPSLEAHELVGFQIPLGFGLTDKKLTKPLNFASARFYGDVGFALSSCPSADFSQAEFLGRATFVSVGFTGPARFYQARFHGAASFSSVQFRGPTIFAQSVFMGECSFQLSSGGFHQLANFNEVRFEQRATFTGYPPDSGFHGLTSFCDLGFASGTNLSFTNLSLAKADFYGTDLQRVRFVGVTWNTLNNRQTLWGEVRLLRIDGNPAARKEHGINERDWPAQPEKLAENYAQLVLAYDQRRDVDSAESFHIGEMEMRRRSIASRIKSPWSKAVREWCNGFGVYRVSSMYGTSYTRAAIVLAIAIMMFSLLFMWAGITSVSTPQGAMIQYQLFPDSAHPPVAPKRWLIDYSHSILYTLAIATFQKDRHFDPASKASEFLTMLAVVVIGAQAALLLFAVRRRFKR